MAENNKCIHCGADCGRNPVVEEENIFCCQGCRQVYKILQSSKLTQYYTIEDTPGIKIDSPPHDSKYAFLDQDEVKEKLYEFHEDNIAKVVFYIPGIHCASCIWLLENLNKLNPGIRQAFVNFINKEYTVSFNAEEISLRQLVELLVSIHYIPEISLKTLEKPDYESSNRKLLYKIGVAGFVFGNVMLYSLPEYFNGEPLNESLGKFLYYLSYGLLLPLVFYSGSDYLVSAFKNLIKGIINIDLPIAIGILALFLVTSYEVLSNSGPGYSDSLSGFLFFLLLGRWYQSKTYQALTFDRDYKSYFPVAVTRVEGDQEESILLENIKIGNLLLIRSKELIPADGTLVDGTALLDYSFVTGESNPVRKFIGEPVYAGGVQSMGAILVRVEKEVEQSHLTQLWNQSDKSTNKHSSIKSLVDKVSVYFTVAILAIALAGFIAWMIYGDFNTAVLVFTSVLIVACPCALALSLPFTFGSAMRILGQHGMYLKNTEVIEKLSRINTVVFDKTGTITKPDQSKIDFIGQPLNEEEIAMVAALARQSVHPLSHALSRQFSETSHYELKGFVEVAGRGTYAKVGKNTIKLGSSEFILGDQKQAHNMSSVVYLSINEKYRGHFEIRNQYREGFDQVIDSLNRSYDLYLLSGDNESEKEHLESYFGQANMLFNQQPIDKMNFIKRLQKLGKNILMTGDGLNDAGAFMESNVAMSVADDIYHFSPAGDVIIEARKFNKLSEFILFGKKSILIIRLSFLISLLYNLIGLGFALSGNLSPVVAAILMPVSSVSVVAFATFGTQLLGRKFLRI